MRQFIKDMNYREGKGSSKKFWYNTAGLAGTMVILWLAYKLPTVDGMDDWAFIWLFGVYLATVGGFDVAITMAKMFLQWKTGASPSIQTTTVTNTTEKKVE